MKIKLIDTRRPQPRWSEYEVQLVEHEYARGGKAIGLVESETGEAFCSVSVWFPETALLEPGEFYVKDWSENEEIVKQLIGNGTLVPVNQPPVQSGFVVSKAYKLCSPITK